MKYEILVQIATEDKVVSRIVQGEDVLEPSFSVRLKGSTLNTSTGLMAPSAALRGPVTEDGIKVQGGVTYKVKGFTKACFYTEGDSTFNEAEWVGAFISSAELNPESDQMEVPLTATVCRLSGNPVNPRMPLTTEYLYVREPDGIETVTKQAPVWERLDVSDEVPALTYQRNDITALKDRQADYSQEITLPLTQHNMAILGLPNLLDSEQAYPYKALPCRMYMGQHAQAGRGAVLSINGIESDGLKCQILGQTADFYNQLKEKPMSDISEPSFERYVASPSTPDGLEWVLAAFNRGGLNIMSFKMDTRFMLPVVNDKWLMRKIIEGMGYEWIHNLGDYVNGAWAGNPAYEEAHRNCLPVVTLDPDEDSFDDMECSATGEIQPLVTLGDVYFVPSVVDSGRGRLQKYGTSPSGPEAYLIYTALMDCEVDVHYSRNEVYQTGNPTPVKFDTRIVLSSADEDVFESLGQWTAYYTGRVKMSEGDTLVLTVASKSAQGYATPLSKYSHGFTVTNYKADYVPFSGKVHAPRNLGFDTQFDFVKGFVQRYGLFVDADRVEKKFYTYTAQKLYDNKVFAKDWTNKLEQAGAEIGFRIEQYAQKNHIELQENSEDNVEDKGTFLVADEVLETEKTFITLPLEAGVEFYTYTGPMQETFGSSAANVPVFDLPELDDEITTDLQQLYNAVYAGGKAHLLRTTQVKGYYPNEQNGGVLEGYRGTFHVKAQTLVDDYYAPLYQRILSNTKTLRAKFALTEADIEDFDAMTPIYLHQYGAHFYVNKINNFVAGSLTTVDLIKL